MADEILSPEELESLPGVGEKLAARIVSYRETHGAFKSADDVMDVPGIGAGRYEKIKDRVTVAQEAGK